MPLTTRVYIVVSRPLTILVYAHIAVSESLTNKYCIAMSQPLTIQDFSIHSSIHSTVMQYNVLHNNESLATRVHVAVNHSLHSPGDIARPCTWRRRGTTSPSHHPRRSAADRWWWRSCRRATGWRWSSWWRCACVGCGRRRSRRAHCQRARGRRWSRRGWWESTRRSWGRRTPLSCPRSPRRWRSNDCHTRCSGMWRSSSPLRRRPQPGGRRPTCSLLNGVVRQVDTVPISDRNYTTGGGGIRGGAATHMQR